MKGIVYVNISEGSESKVIACIKRVSNNNFVFFFFFFFFYFALNIEYEYAKSLYKLMLACQKNLLKQKRNCIISWCCSRVNV